MAEYLGAELNPKTIDSPTCIYVKQHPPEDYPSGSFIDPVDGDGLLPWINNHPDIGVIAISKLSQQFLSSKLNRDDIYFIPEHHCNYERWRRVGKPVDTVGFIGYPSSCHEGFDFFAKKFHSLGFKFLYKTSFRNRLDVVLFLSQIDIQIGYRPYMPPTIAKLKNPLKLANAGSFGIPTVAFREENYDLEFENCYVAIDCIDDLFSSCCALRDSEAYYNHMARAALKRSEDYHISKVAQRYRRLTRRQIMNYGTKAKLLDRRIVIDGKQVDIFGLASFSVSPKSRGLGRIALQGFERLARQEGKYTVVGFALPDVVEFYLNCGWYDCGTFGEKTAFSPIPFRTEWTEDW
jgi:hypothetical protein